MEESIIQPSLIRDRDFIRETVILVPFPFSLRKMLSFISERVRVKTTRFNIFNLITLEDKVILGPAMGAPSAVILLEELIALGARTIITFGICGSLHESVRIGDLLVATAAYSEEGTSKHYAPASPIFYADESLTAEIKDFLNQAELSYKEGTLVSTDAPYRETPSMIKKYQRGGASGVDMELSAIYALARFRKVRASALMVVSDELFAYRWNPGFGSPRFKSALARVAKRLICFKA